MHTIQFVMEIDEMIGTHSAGMGVCIHISMHIISITNRHGEGNVVRRRQGVYYCMILTVQWADIQRVRVYGCSRGGFHLI